MNSASSHTICSRQRFLSRTAALLYLLISFEIMLWDITLLNNWGIDFPKMPSVGGRGLQRISLFMIFWHVAVYPTLSFALLRRGHLAPIPALALLTIALFGFHFLTLLSILGGIGNLTTNFLVLALLHLAGLLALVATFRVDRHPYLSTLSKALLIALDSLRLVLLSILACFFLVILSILDLGLFLDILSFVSRSRVAREAAPVPREARTAPEGTIEVRRAWGERVYGTYLRYVNKWVHTSAAIKRDVGTVATIAPLGAPNYYQSCFTDGCHAVMRLEVAGNKGVGILELPNVQVSNYKSSEYSLEKIGSATWTFNGDTAEIDISGELLVRSSGLEDVVTKLNELYEQGKGEAFLTTLAAHESDLYSRAGIITWRRLVPRKTELLIKDGVPTQQILDSLDQLLELLQFREQEVSPNVGMLSREWEEYLLLALRGLRYLVKERDLSTAEKRKVFFMASDVQKRRRFGFHDDSFGGRFTPYGSSEERKVWGEKTLGLFYRNAAKHIESHPWVIKALGTITSIVPASHKQNEIDISPDGHYSAMMTLNIEGTKGSAVVSIFAKEQCPSVPPLDIYADSIRPPQAPIALHQIKVIQLDENGKEGKTITLNGERERC